MANICSSTPIRDTSIKGLTAELNFIRSTICTLQSQVINGGGPTIYTGDGSLPENRTIDLNGQQLHFHSGNNDYGFFTDVGNEHFSFNADNGSGFTRLIGYASIADGFAFYLQTNNNVGIEGDGDNSELVYTAATHTFNVGMTITELAGVGTRAIAVDATGKIVLL